MKLLVKILILVTYLGVVSCGVNKKANKEFSLGRFQNTIDIYSKVLEKNPDDAEANFFIAESYRQSNRMFEAAPFYEKAMINGMENDSIQLFYAFALKSRGEYDQARSELDEFLKTTESENMKARANEEFDNMDFLVELKAIENFFRV